MTAEDSMRALDSVAPPEQWNEIEARAARPEEAAVADAPAPVGGSTGRRLLAATAAVAAVAGIAVGLAMVRAGDEADEVGSGPVAEGASGQGFWGNRWQLVGIDVGGASVTEELITGDGSPILLDARVEGELVYQVCNAARIRAQVADGRLAYEEAFQTAAGCPDPLDQLVWFEDAEVLVEGTSLELARPATRGVPALTYRFVREGSLTLAQQLWGRRWRVTSIEDSATGTRIEPTADDDLLLDLSAEREGLVEVNACGGHSAFASLEGEVLAVGAWQQRMADCGWQPRFAWVDRVEEVLGAGAAVRVEGTQLTLASDAGVVEAILAAPRPDLFDLFADPFDPGTARWLIVEARDRGEPQAWAEPPVLAARRQPESPELLVTVAGCNGAGGEVEIDDEASRLVPVEPWAHTRMGCTEVLGAQDRWFEELLLAGPEVQVVSQRASIGIPGRQLVLVRLD